MRGATRREAIAKSWSARCWLRLPASDSAIGQLRPIVEDAIVVMDIPSG
jgi:hypothetical protein